MTDEQLEAARNYMRARSLMSTRGVTFNVADLVAEIDRLREENERLNGVLVCVRQDAVELGEERDEARAEVERLKAEFDERIKLRDDLLMNADDRRIAAEREMLSLRSRLAESQAREAGLRAVVEYFATPEEPGQRLEIHDARAGFLAPWQLFSDRARAALSASPSEPLDAIREAQRAIRFWNLHEKGDWLADAYAALARVFGEVPD